MIWLIISILAVRVYAVPIADDKKDRSGKFMRFGTPDDIFSEVLDDMQDPLSGAEEMNISDRLKDSPHNSKPTVHHRNTSDPTNTENTALHNQNTGKFELISSTSGHFMLPAKPEPDNGVVFYGGHHYRYRKPSTENPNHGNRTGEIKIFWSSVTDAIENLPFIPIQVNVPDMISAMANFLSTSLPIINRFTNPNHPRLPIRKPDDENENFHRDQQPYRENNSVEEREFKNERNPIKSRKSQKRKGLKRKPSKGSTKVLPTRPFIRRTTEAPNGDKKIWHALGTGPALKNMPITRKRINVRDREIFNFKNSDISNSPIMILNLPERPMMYYKTNVQQKVGDKTVVSTEKPRPATQSEIAPTSKTPPKRYRNAPKRKGNSTERSKSN